MSNSTKSFSLTLSALVGVIIALLIANNSGEGFWDTLHHAYLGNLVHGLKVSAYTIPLCVLLAFLLYLATKSKLDSSLKGTVNLGQKILSVLLPVLPALHWSAGLFFFLQASRYSPKLGLILSGSFQITMLALSILASLAFAHGHRLKSWLVFSYIGISVIASLLWLVGFPVGIMQLGPLITQLPDNETMPDLFLLIVLSFYGILAILMRFILIDPQLEQQQPHLLTKAVNKMISVWYIIMMESTLLFAATLCLFAYFITSQFDNSPTTILTHSLLIILSILLTYIGLLVERNLVTARRCFLYLAIPLFVIEIIIMIFLHSSDEFDPIILITLVVLIIAACIINVAIGFFRYSAQSTQDPDVQ